jgi:hypothetical protein
MLQKLSAVGFAALLACSTLATGSAPAMAQGFHHGHHGSYAGRHHGGFAGPRHFHGHRHYYYHGGRRYYGYGYGYDDYNYGGAAVAAGIIGLAAGAIAAGAINNSRGVGYCERHFRSYNPRTGLYKGFDGRFHPCP